jgi:copper chaperone CopZ
MRYHQGRETTAMKMMIAVMSAFLALSSASLQARACEDDAEAAQDSKHPSLTLTESGPQKAVFQVSGIMCRSCEKKIQAALRKVDGVKAVTFQKLQGKGGVRVTEVTFEKGGKVTPAVLAQAVEGAGYKATLAQ